MFDSDIPYYAHLDEAEERLIALEAEIARARAEQARILAWLNRVSVARIHGARSLEEWTAAHIDVAPTTARDLVRTARRTAETAGVVGELIAGLAGGDLSFDRAVATETLVTAGASDADVTTSFQRDLAGVRRLAAKVRRVTRVDERELVRRRHLTLEPTLGETAWRIGGLAPGYDGSVVLKALQERADLLPKPPPDEREGRGQRMLDALTALAQDFLDGTHPLGGSTVAGGSSVTLFVETNGSTPATSGDVAASIAAGPIVGPDTIERMLCEGMGSLVGLENGRPVITTNGKSEIPPATRKAVLHRDGGCVMDGCRSRYRLQPHHIRPRSNDGQHEMENLATLCWYHHHIAVHSYGKRLDPDSPPHRRRFLVGPAKDPPVRWPLVPFPSGHDRLAGTIPAPATSFN